MDAPDQFLNLTAAGWTAIGSFVSTASVIVLDSYRRIRKQEYFNKITRLRAVG
jgi:hypothetical protein